MRRGRSYLITRCCVHVCEFSPVEKNLRRIVHPNQKHNQRTGAASRPTAQTFVRKYDMGLAVNVLLRSRLQLIRSVTLSVRR
jgi:hypothetical protein